MFSLVAPSGECLRVEGLVWLIEAVVCSLVAYRGSNCSLARTMDNCIQHCSTTGFCRSTAASMIVKRGWSGFVPVRCCI